MDDDRRVELVGTAPEDGRRAQRIGIGLLVSLVVGYGPLHDAATGGGSFPLAVARYLACLACSLAAVLTLGRLLDGAPGPEPDESAASGPEAAGEAAPGGAGAGSATGPGDLSDQRIP